jgi:hypothetical protein
MAPGQVKRNAKRVERQLSMKDQGKLFTIEDAQASGDDLVGVQGMC